MPKKLVVQEHGLTDTNTLGEARQFILDVKNKGTVASCPCCLQTVKVYPRHLNGMISRILVLINNHFEAHPEVQWAHVERDILSQLPEDDATRRCRYFSLLERWGLICARPGERSDGSRRTGYWCITQRGKDFVAGRVNVPRIFFMFNGDNEGFSTELININEALASGGFDYDEMMQPFDQASDIATHTSSLLSE